MQQHTADNLLLSRWPEIAVSLQAIWVKLL